MPPETEVVQVDTTLNPDDNQYTVRFYGRDGELIQEQRAPVQWVETEAVDVNTGQTTELPRLEFDDGWLTYGVGATVQGTSSNEYRMAGRNLDIEEIIGLFDTNTRMDDDERYGNPYVRRYTEDERDLAEDYLRMVYGTRTELRDDFIRTRIRYLDEIYLKGEWKIPEEEERPDIQEERGGALDEFLEKFTPQKTTTERSDEQE